MTVFGPLPFFHFPSIASLTMPKDTSIKKILLIGAGPIVIGQGCEFDYSGVQACKALAEEGYDVMRGLLHTEVSERTLAARFFERVCELGSPTPASESVVSKNAQFGGTPHSRRLEAGDLVTFTPSALYAGYEGGFGRTIEVGPPTQRNQELIASTETSCHQLIERCVPGATGRTLVADGEALGLGPEQLLIHGLGLGAEWPLLGFGMGAHLRLETGMVLSVHVRREDADGRAALHKEMVQITDDGPVTLSRKAGQ